MKRPKSIPRGRCLDCGLNNHVLENCSFEEMACRFCNKKGYPSVCCKENSKSYWFLPRGLRGKKIKEEEEEKPVKSQEGRI